MSDEDVQRAFQVLRRHGVDPVEQILLAPHEIQVALGDIWHHLRDRRSRRWQPRKGKSIQFSDLTDTHLINILKCYDRGTDIEGRKFNDKSPAYIILTREAYYRNLTYIGYIGNNPIINPWELVREYCMC